MTWSPGARTLDSMSTNLEITSPSAPTADRTHHWLAAASSALWLLVAAATLSGDDDDWEVAYAVFSGVRRMAAAVIGFTVVRWGRPATRVLVWRVGVGLLVAAILTTVVAWASPLWQASLAIAFVSLAVGTDRPRTPLLVLAGAQLAGLAAFFIADAMEVGDVDSYGDYPLAGDISVVLSSLLTAAAVWFALRSSGERSAR